jgi:hypothetical protein
MPLSTGFLTSLSYELAVYDTRVTNEIVPYRGGRFYFTAGKADRRGLEIGTSVAGAHDLEIAASLTASRNRYLEYTVDSVHYGRPGRLSDYSGNSIAGIPSLMYSVSAARSIGNAIPVKLRIGLRGVGEYVLDDANTVEIPAYHTFSATASLSKGIPLGDFAVKAFVTAENLGNSRYIGSAFVNPDVVNGVPVAFEPGAARSWIFSISIGPRD